MSYKDIMTEEWYPHRPSQRTNNEILEAAMTPCRLCSMCTDIAIANGCTATNCIICGHEIDQKDVAGMSGHDQYVCTKCGVELSICAGRSEVAAHIITGYCITVSGTPEDVI